MYIRYSVSVDINKGETREENSFVETRCFPRNLFFVTIIIM